MSNAAASRTVLDVSIIVCTWNRCQLLARTLESMTSLDVPAGMTWEIVVVDNGCTDRTPEIISEYAERLPLNVVREHKLGVSAARNTGARSSRGKLLLFTDDDVLLNREWMIAYRDAAERWPDAGFFGGEIVPEFETPPPRWVANNLDVLHGLFAGRDFGRHQRDLNPSEVPYGPNMAFRKEMFELAQFDVRVGRCGHEQVRCGETSIYPLLRSQGVRGVWVPEAKVRHFVPASRCNLRYFWNLYVGLGRAEYRLGRHAEVKPVGRLAKSLFKMTVKICLGRSDWVENLARAARSVGRLLEARAQSRSARAQPPAGQPVEKTKSEAAC